MSADNGIYILVSPIPNSMRKEYRVSYAQAIDSLYYFPKDNVLNAAMEVYMFHKAPIFFTEEEAVDYAYFLSKKCGYLEYGFGIMLERKNPYPKMGFKRACEMLDWEFV